MPSVAQADTAPAQPAPTPTRAATTTAAAAPTTTSSNTTLIQIVIAAVCGVLLLVLVMFILWKYRRRQKTKARDAARNRAQEDAYGGRETPQVGEVVSRTHPAGLMIMKADGSGTPRFVHTPGTNMRTAIRRADGAWEFSDPRAPFRPEIIADDVDRGSVYTTNDQPDTPSHSQLSYARTYSRSPSPAASASGRSDAGVNELLVPQRQTVAPWGAVPKTSASEAWRGGVYSPEPTTASANKTFLPPPLPSTSSSALLSAPVRELEDELVSPVSAYSNVLYVDVDRERDPFRTPRGSPSPTPRRPERTDPSPLWTPAPEPGKTFLEPAVSTPIPTRPERTAPLWTPAPTQGAKTFFEEQMPVLAGPGPVTAGAQRVIGESRAAREIRLGYEALDRGEGSSSGSGAVGGVPVAEAGLSPAARAKEAESRAARAIRQGYDERDSEYAEMEELPAY